MELIHHHFDTLSSTNDWARAQIESFCKDKITVISAKKQTAGRGQYGRQWLSPAGNLYITFCFFVPSEQRDPLSITHVLAITLALLLEEEGISVQIKWPNDLLVQGKKIGGILCETVPFEGEVGVIVGLGLNVEMSQKMLASLPQPATSFALEKGSSLSNEILMKRLESGFSSALMRFLKEGFTPFLPTFRRLVLNR